MNFLFLILFFTFASANHNIPKNVAIRWSEEHLRVQKVTSGFMSPPAVARALLIVNSCMYDSMTVYTDNLNATMDYGIARRPVDERKTRNIKEAISYCAYRAIKDLFSTFPSATAGTDTLMMELGYNPFVVDESESVPSGVGNKVARILLAYRHRDGMNQLGDEVGTPVNGTAYSDYTNYAAVNPAQDAPHRTDCSKIVNINKWQPLRVPKMDGTTSVQTWTAPYMERVKPFATSNGKLFRVRGPALNGTNTQSQFYQLHADLVDIYGGLNDTMKVIAEFWADGVGTVTPPGHWQNITIEVAVQRRISLRNTVKLLFLQAAASFDAGVAVWAIKRFYDSVRPITAIQCIYGGMPMQSWKGPYQGIGLIDGSQWIPYQSPYSVTPPFAEYCSGHSGFSAASAEVLKRFFGTDAFGGSVVIHKGESLFEGKIERGQPGYIAGVTDVPNRGPNTVGYSPATNIRLEWDTFSDAAAQSGISRRYGGIHLEYADLDGRMVGRETADNVWSAYVALVGTAAPVDFYDVDAAEAEDNDD